jgi:hypothetical protein
VCVQCHHINGKDLYSQIMQFFYAQVDEPNRPRVLGLTACLIKVRKQTNLSASLSYLETILDSDIFTCDESELGNYIRLPDTMIQQFEELDPVIEEALAELFDSPSNPDIFFHLFTATREGGLFGFKCAVNSLRTDRQTQDIKISRQSLARISEIEEVLASLLPPTSSKLEALYDILNSQKREKIMIFTERRITEYVV